MIDVFISYAREDETEAAELFRTIKSNGFRPWMDKVNLIPGQDWRLELEKAVKQSHVQIFVCTSRSVNKRGFFQNEIRLALDAALSILEDDISIIPLIAEDCDLPQSLGRFQWLRKDDPQFIQKLVQALSMVAEQRGILDAANSGEPIVKRFVTQERDESDRFFNSSIEVPELFFPKDEDLTLALNAVILGGLVSSMNHFRAEAIDDPHAAERKMNNFYEAGATVSLLNERIISIVSGSYYYGGGVHPNSHRQSLNIDVEERSLFNPRLLFEDIKVVSDDLIRKVSDEGFALIKPDDVPKLVKDTFPDMFLLRPEGAEMMFNSYDVFPYAYGPFSIDLPYSHPLFREQNLTSKGRRLLNFSKRTD